MATAAEKQAKQDAKDAAAQSVTVGKSRLGEVNSAGAFAGRRLRSAGDLSRYGIGGFLDDPNKLKPVTPTKPTIKPPVKPLGHVPPTARVTMPPSKSGSGMAAKPPTGPGAARALPMGPAGKPGTPGSASTAARVAANKQAAQQKVGKGATQYDYGEAPRAGQPQDTGSYADAQAEKARARAVAAAKQKSANAQAKKKAAAAQQAQYKKAKAAASSAAAKKKAAAAAKAKAKAAAAKKHKAETGHAVNTGALE
jgi:chemotaxis protein histidine kinase CheA